MTGRHLGHHGGDVLLVELDVEVVGQGVEREAPAQRVACLRGELGLPGVAVKAGLGEDVVEREPLHLQALHRLGEQLVAHLGDVALVGLSLQARGKLGCRELHELGAMGAFGLALEHRAHLVAQAQQRLGLGEVLGHPGVVDLRRHAAMDLVDLHLDLNHLVVDGAVLRGHGKRQRELLALTRRHALELGVELVAELARTHQVGEVATAQLREGPAVKLGVEVERDVGAALHRRGRGVVLPGGKLVGHVVEVGAHVLGAHLLLLRELHAHGVVGAQLVAGAQQRLHLEGVVLAGLGHRGREVVGLEEGQHARAQQGLGEEVALHERRDEGVEGLLAHLLANDLERLGVGRGAEGGGQSRLRLLDGLRHVVSRGRHGEVGHAGGVGGELAGHASGLGVVLKLADATRLRGFLLLAFQLLNLGLEIDDVGHRVSFQVENARSTRKGASGLKRRVRA